MGKNCHVLPFIHLSLPPSSQQRNNKSKFHALTANEKCFATYSEPHSRKSVHASVLRVCGRRRDRNPLSDGSLLFSFCADRHALWGVGSLHSHAENFPALLTLASQHRQPRCGGRGDRGEIRKDGKTGEHLWSVSLLRLPWNSRTGREEGGVYLAPKAVATKRSLNSLRAISPASALSPIRNVAMKFCKHGISGCRWQRGSCRGREV